MTKGIHGTCETVKIKSSLPGGFVEINATDFDETKHKIFGTEEVSKDPKTTDAPVALSATAQKLVDDNGLDVTKIVGTGKDGSITVADVKAAIAAKKAEPINATPEAIAFAEEAAFDLIGVKGTGENGVITLEDVQDAIEAKEESEA